MPYHGKLMQGMKRMRWKGKQQVTAAKGMVGRTIGRIMPRRTYYRMRNGLRKYSTSAAKAAKAAVPTKESSGIVFRAGSGISK